MFHLSATLPRHVNPPANTQDYPFTRGRAKRHVRGSGVTLDGASFERTSNLRWVDLTFEVTVFPDGTHEPTEDFIRRLGASHDDTWVRLTRRQRR